MFLGQAPWMLSKCCILSVFTLYVDCLKKLLSGHCNILGFPGGLDSKEAACSAGDLGSIPELARSPGEGNGNTVQYSGLENPMDRGTWQATVHGVAIVGHGLATKPPYQPRQIRKQSIF